MMPRNLRKDDSVMANTKKFLSMLLTVAMALTLLPATVFATGSGQVYISISDDGQFISDPNGQPMANRAVALDALTAIDLDEYGLTDYKYDADSDGNYEITLLHLYIYVHEQILGLDWADVDTSGGSPLGMYFSGGLFGFADENMRYNYNGAYPADESGWGYTADWLVLKAGDFFDVGHFSDWMFYMDSAYGFNYFATEEDVITQSFTATAGKEMKAKLLLVGGGMGMPSSSTPQTGFTVFYGQSIGSSTGSVETDDSGTAAITFPSAGTWYIWCDGGEGVDNAAGAIVSGPASATVTVTGGTEPEQPREAQDVSAVINATMAKMASTVTEPTFGTNAGEWTVLSLARGGYYAKGNAYFAGYYDRIVKTVNEKAASVNLNGALHKSKSTDNSRLIVALSSIGKDSTSVGNWDLTAPYNDFGWIKNQGINGVVWALLALDSHSYTTTDTTIRQQCVDYLLDAELAEGGWPMSGNSMDVDMTAMTLQALYPYRDQAQVSAAAQRAITLLSDSQLQTGGFLYGTGETSESSAQVIVALATWGINPDTDSRFIKNGNSVVDNLLSYYLQEDAMFAHQGSTSSAMATDQACYALIAYDRLLKSKPALYDFSDVVFEAPLPREMAAGLGLPAQINAGESFSGTVTINKWDNEAGYKLLDFVMNIPEGVTVTDVTAGSALCGGQVTWNQDGNALRVVYFDANEHTTLTVSGTQFPVDLFSIGFKAETVSAGSDLDFTFSGMSVKLTSDSEDEDAMVVINTDGAKAAVEVVAGISYSAKCLYTGDGVDLIPSGKKAVAVAVTGIASGAKLSYNDGTNAVEFKYSAEISAKTGVSTYVALVDAAIAMENFVNERFFTVPGGAAPTITFGDTNGDGVINAQDALNTVDTWLRKGDAPTDDQILTMNVNGDSRINTFDALGIVEAFISKTDHLVVTKAAALANTQ